MVGVSSPSSSDARPPPPCWLHPKDGFSRQQGWASHLPIPLIGQTELTTRTWARERGGSDRLGAGAPLVSQEQRMFPQNHVAPETAPSCETLEEEIDVERQIPSAHHNTFSLHSTLSFSPLVDQISNHPPSAFLPVLKGSPKEGHRGCVRWFSAF